MSVIEIKTTLNIVKIFKQKQGFPIFEVQIEVMKAQLVILFLLFSVLSTQAFANEKELQQDKQKTQKMKYDFNIFKLYSIPTATVQSADLKTKVNFLSNFRKEN